MPGASVHQVDDGLVDARPKANVRFSCPRFLTHIHEETMRDLEQYLQVLSLLINFGDTYRKQWHKLLQKSNEETHHIRDHCWGLCPDVG